PWLEVDEEHEILDINRSKQVLMEMAGFDFDPVGYGVTHQQITSPLPPRIVGEWGDEVVHPKISDYVDNTEEGKKLHEYFTDYLADRADQDKKLRDLYEKNTNLGFGTIQRNIQGFAGQVFGGEAGQRGIEDFSRGFQSAMGGAASATPGTQQARGTRPTASQQQRIKSAVKRITAAGTLLLFRYFDFDVEPGKTYQYRVRLIFENPNFNAPVSELENPDSRLGETRSSPWSELTAPITVLQDTEYYLSRVSVPPGKKSEESSLLMYQWKPGIGTVISDRVNSQLGQYIGGETVTEVLKPALQTFEMEKVEFTSDDLLVDSSQGVDVNYKDHADLNLPKRLTGKGRLRIMDEALVQDASGRLFSIDPFSSSTEKQNARKRFEWQNLPWQFLKDQPEPGEMGEYGDEIDDFEDAFEDEEDEGGVRKKPRGRRDRFRRKNNLKKSFGSFEYDD
ncbi:MAG: hypothetical protein IH899_13250, partial [Planctomycetes bacterium]|nr:hypothetical protein [Planctomycetota bacterium]